jgi:pantoate--beta-alanine ligase
MAEAAAALRSGNPVDRARALLTQRLLSAGFAGVDYAEVREADSLAPLDSLGAAPARLLVAARIGKARLIDNCKV